eukprot:1101473-Alexandrium_andersonii.AAC.1
MHSSGASGGRCLRPLQGPAQFQVRAHESQEDNGANAKVLLCAWGARGTWNLQDCFRRSELEPREPGKDLKIGP